MPGLPPSDTIKAVDESGRVTSTLDRAALVTVQTPQAFRAAALRRAHAEAPAVGATDDAMLVEALGGTVLVVPGEPGNLKITDPDDLGAAERLLEARPMVSVRIGQGIDVHRFSEDPHRPLVLGGVVIEGARGLGGHSDADAVCHALADAVLGAVGLGDLGRHFPDTDPVWEGADSVSLLTEVLAMAAEHGYACANADCTVIADAPRLAPHTAAMVERLERGAAGSRLGQGDPRRGTGRAGARRRHRLPGRRADGVAVTRRPPPRGGSRRAPARRRAAARRGWRGRPAGGAAPGPAQRARG